MLKGGWRPVWVELMELIYPSPFQAMKKENAYALFVSNIITVVFNR